jgi:MFS family permease
MSIRGTALSGGLALGLTAAWNIANVGPAARVLADAYGVRLGTVGFLTTALFLTHFAVQIPGGRIIDRVGARRVGFAALAAITVGNTIALATASFPLALVGRLVAGVGTGTGFIAGSDYTRVASGSATAQGIYGGASVGGGGLAVAIVPLLTPSLGWRAPYVSALALVPLGLALALAPADAPRPPRAERGLGDVVRDRRLYPLAAVHTASFGFSVILGNWIVPLLTHDGYSRRIAGVVGAFTLLGGLLTRPLGGVAIQRSSHATPLLVGGSMLAGAVGTLLVAAPVALPLRLAASAVVGLAAGIPFAAAFTGAAARRPDTPAAAVGLVNSSATLTIVAGAPLVGFGFALPGHGRIGFAVIAALWATAALAAVPPRLTPGPSRG